MDRAMVPMCSRRAERNGKYIALSKDLRLELARIADNSVLNRLLIGPDHFRSGRDIQRVWCELKIIDLCQIGDRPHGGRRADRDEYAVRRAESRGLNEDGCIP